MFSCCRRAASCTPGASGGGAAANAASSLVEPSPDSLRAASVIERPTQIRRILGRIRIAPAQLRSQAGFRILVLQLAINLDSGPQHIRAQALALGDARNVEPGAGEVTPCKI